MGQYFSRHYDHLIVATKKRRPDLKPELLKGVGELIAETLRHRRCILLAFGGTADHVHLLIEIHRSKSLAQIVRDIKSVGSDWLRAQGAAEGGFSWQSGWAAFSVSHSNLKSVRDYIGRQKEIHEKMSFRQELIGFLKKHEIPFDERYLH